MQVALGALQKFVLELAELSSVFSHLTGAGDSTSHTLYTLILSHSLYTHYIFLFFLFSLHLSFSFVFSFLSLYVCSLAYQNYSREWHGLEAST